MKKNLVILCVLLVCAGCSAKQSGGQQSAVGSSASSQTYKIGDTGPAGGIVFYDKGVVSDGWRYLEAAPRNLGKAGWGAYGVDTGTRPEIGAGKWNTEFIIAALNAKGETGKAAQLCKAYTQNGYNDWFLPSKDELDLMYKNLRQMGLGGFDNDGYWSSSQSNKDYAWCQIFSDGYQKRPTKGVTGSVRAVRAF
jgi:hypothetical protein